MKLVNLFSIVLVPVLILVSCKENPNSIEANHNPRSSEASPGLEKRPAPVEDPGRNKPQMASNPYAPISLTIGPPTLSLSKTEITVDESGQIHLMGLSGQFRPYANDGTEKQLASHFKTLRTRAGVSIKNGVLNDDFHFTFDINASSLIEIKKHHYENDFTHLIYRAPTGEYKIGETTLNGLQPNDFYGFHNSLSRIATADENELIIIQKDNPVVTIFNRKTSRMVNVDQGTSPHKPAYIEIGKRRFLKVFYRDENDDSLTDQVRIYELPEGRLHTSIDLKGKRALWPWRDFPFVLSIQGKQVHKTSILDGTTKIGFLANLDEELRREESHDGYSEPLGIISEKGYWAQNLWLLPEGNVEAMLELSLKRHAGLDTNNFFRIADREPLSGAIILGVHSKERDHVDKERSTYEWVEAYSPLDGKFLGSFDRKQLPSGRAKFGATNDGKFIIFYLASYNKPQEVLVFEATSGQLAFRIPQAWWTPHLSNNSRWLFTRIEGESGFQLTDLNAKEETSMKADSNIPGFGRLMYAGFDDEVSSLALFGEQGYAILTDPNGLIARPNPPSTIANPVSETTKATNLSEEDGVSQPLAKNRILEMADIKIGTGATPQFGDRISIHYVMKNLDGRLVGSSRALFTPFTFPLGGPVFSAWNKAVLGSGKLGPMKVGGIRRLIAPPQDAYGEAGFPPHVAPNAYLEMEIELLEVK